MIYKGRIWRQASLSIAATLGNLEGRSVYQGIQETVKQGSGNGASLSIGATLGNLEGRFVYQGIQETVKQGSGNGASVCLYGGSARETWRVGSFTGTSES